MTKVTSDARAQKPRVVFSQELITHIFDRIASGESMNSVCSTPDMPTRKSVFEWIANDPQVKAGYEIALTMRAEVMADELLTIADAAVGSTDTGATDSGAVNKQRLQVDTRKWLLSKLAPKKYGDKLETAHTGPDGGPVLQEIVRRIVDPSDRPAT